jgi:hypothetical protein
MPDEYKQVEAIMGPYRGHRLTMTAADADAAVNAHWARDPFAEPAVGEGTRANEVPQGEAAAEQQAHPPLTDEERAAAYEASVTWAKAQWDAAAGIEPPPEPPEPPPEGVTESRRARAMKPDENPEGYRTRGR